MFRELDESEAPRGAVRQPLDVDLLHLPGFRLSTLKLAGSRSDLKPQATHQLDGFLGTPWVPE